ncbi:hypothetical protein CMK14_14305 [Candidatus Poribacteria bacterium]|nr:hypothetical protein [Candidatus Poribacteria bacterium]
MKSGRFDVYIWLNQGIDKLYAEYLAKEIIIVEPLEITFFQVRQLLIQDDNGYLLCFGEEV